MQHGTNGTAQQVGEPVCSVCIANYNGMQVIDDCIRSVREQLGGIPVEILVHDDASTDGSVAYIRDHYTEARLIVSESNVGFCIANNRMAAEAKGKYLLLLNNDAALFPDALQILLAEANRLDRPAILSLPQYDAASGELVDMGALLDPFLNLVPNRDPEFSDVATVIGACLWIPRNLWEELGGLPPWFESIAEDLYLCCRARLAGCFVRSVPNSGYRHWQGASFGGNKLVSNRLSTTFRRRALSERNKSFVMVVTYPTPMLHLLLPLHLVLLVLEGLLLALVKREMRVFQHIYLACLRSLWEERHRLYDLRREIQARRRIGIRLFLAAFRPTPHKLRMLCRHGLPHLR